MTEGTSTSHNRSGALYVYQTTAFGFHWRRGPVRSRTTRQAIGDFGSSPTIPGWGESQVEEAAARLEDAHATALSPQRGIKASQTLAT
jgi:hypothetical protein